MASDCSSPNGGRSRLDNVPLLPMSHDRDEDHDSEDGGRNGQYRGSPDSFSRRRHERSIHGSTSFWGKIIRRHSVESPICIGRTKDRGGIHTAGKSRLCSILLYFIAVVFLVLGFVQFISIIFLSLSAVFPDQAAYFRDHWGTPSRTSQNLWNWPTDFSRDIQPVPCHSHNDYWRKIPLYSALEAGCIGVEADIWLVDDELFVGHSRSSLTFNRTLQSLYINPLLEILSRQNPTTKFHPEPETPPNGVFDTDPEQTLILLIDFKTDGAALWPHVQSQLGPLRSAGYLTRATDESLERGPITVVGTGNTPFNLILTNNTHRDIFFDAPLDLMANSDLKTAPVLKYNNTNSFYASTSFNSAIGSIWSKPSVDQLDLIRSQIQGAHARGLKARFWDTPSWPRGLRNRIWNILIEEGADILNVDDLEDATKGSWGSWGSWK